MDLSLTYASDLLQGARLEPFVTVLVIALMKV
jgi:hypothetical protein